MVLGLSQAQQCCKVMAQGISADFPLPNVRWLVFASDALMGWFGRTIMTNSGFSQFLQCYCCQIR